MQLLELCSLLQVLLFVFSLSLSPPFHPFQLFWIQFRCLFVRVLRFIAGFHLEPWWLPVRSPASTALRGCFLSSICLQFCFLYSICLQFTQSFYKFPTDTDLPPGTRADALPKDVHTRHRTRLPRKPLIRSCIDIWYSEAACTLVVTAAHGLFWDQESRK